MFFVVALLLKFLIQLRFPRNVSILRACKEVGKQRELALLALRRTVLCSNKCLEFHNQKASKSIYSESTLTCSISTINGDFSLDNSGLELNEVQEQSGVKDRECQVAIWTTRYKEDN